MPEETSVSAGGASESSAEAVSAPTEAVDSGGGSPAGEQEPQAEQQQPDAEAAPKALSPQLLERASKLGIDQKLLTSLGDRAEEAVNSYEAQVRSDMDALGEKLMAEQEAKAKQDADTAKKPAAESKPAPEKPAVEGENFLDPGEEYDEQIRGVFGKTSAEIRNLQRVAGHLLSEMQKLGELRQSLWKQQHSNFLQSRGQEWQEITSDPRFHEEHARKMNALALAYQHEERPFTEAQIMQEAFDILTASRAKQAAQKQVIDAVKQNQKRLSTPPNRRAGAPREPVTAEEARDRELRDMYETMAAYGLASQAPFAQE